jgi:non-heme chloroperoxidase
MVWNIAMGQLANTTRRSVLLTGLLSGISLTPRLSSAAGEETRISTYPAQRTEPMTTVTTKDGVQIFYKDWGPRTAQPIFFHHGWPLSSDDWDAQMLYFVGKGFRVIAHDRRGHGRSSQVSDGHDMDHYAADVTARSSGNSTFAMSSTSAIPPAAAKPRATSRVTATVAWRSWC